MAATKVCTLCTNNQKVVSKFDDPHDQTIVKFIKKSRPEWNPEQGACLSCLDKFHQDILKQLINLENGEGYTVLPTPVRLNAHPDYSGKGVTICFIDSGFFLHPDLIAPKNRIKKIIDITHPKRSINYFKDPHNNAWHGTMTSVVCAGNGQLSEGVYKGVAYDAELILLKVMDEEHKISEANIIKALTWVKKNHKKFDIKIVNLSVTGDEEVSYKKSEIDQLVSWLFNAGINVVAAVGNDTSARILPPANSPEVIAVGGLDDRNTLDPIQQNLYHSTYGYTIDQLIKPELIAPAIWIAAPILPKTDAAKEADFLFDQLTKSEDKNHFLNEIKSKKLISPHYQYADGTSFAAPIVCAVIAQMLQASPSLSPEMIREILLKTARPISSETVLRQGYGVLQAGHAVSKATKETHHKWIKTNPVIDYASKKIIFRFHDHEAKQIHLTGNFNDWNPTVTPLKLEKEGGWKVEIPLLPKGTYQYKFIINKKDWTIDPLNFFKEVSGYNNFNSVFYI